MAEYPQIVFAGTDGGAVTSYRRLREGGGFSALRKARAMAPDDVIAELEPSGLRGRGGAFFPTGRKWSFVPKPDQLAKPHYLVVNADESEPGSFKDREIMLRVPFRFLEGCLIAAHGIQSQHVFVYIRGEYEREFEILRDSLEAMRKADLLGGVTVVLHRGRRRVHLRRGDGAPRVARGKARAAADEAAVPCDRGPLRRADRGEQRRVDHDGHVGLRDGRQRVREARRRELDRDARLLAVGRRREPRELRAPTRDLDARADLRRRRRRPERARAEGDDPGRLVDLGAHRGRHRHRRWTSPRSSRPAPRSARRA